ncbi:MAG TPA: UDP-N-acetylmuramoyl-tripeptide--D-alanyl-D-alanine ligase [Candidatus Saccharimonadales bacterium]|nr:UDP-N-acetylmuramoyl-tripeptide--D-alanyl-D-alanine ligase [Candidatus Saccharimonadales bacterium]
MNFDLYSEVKSWKRPIHASKAYLAKSYLRLLPKLDVIAITGSVGKTLTQNAIYAVLSQKFKCILPEENLDPTFRIPQTILKTKPWHQKLILEYGVEHPGEMDSYLQIAPPKIAVITAIASTHTKYFGTKQGVFEEKSKLVKALDKNGQAILNADDPYVVKMADLTKAKIWWYGKSAKNGIKISHYSQNLHGARFRLHYLGQKASVSWKIIGKHQLTSAYAAATVGIASGLTVKQIAKGLTQTKQPAHRLSPIVTKHANIIDDTYNSSPKASQESLATLVDLGRGKKKVAVFGEMKDLGDISKEEHRKLGLLVAKSKINYLITIGKTAQEIATAARNNGFSGKILQMANTKEAIGEAKKLIGKKSLVLVKGSRHAHLERIVNGLLHKSTTVNCYHCGVLK